MFSGGGASHQLEDGKARSASKNHSEAEKRRRDRINAHLTTHGDEDVEFELEKLFRGLPWRCSSQFLDLSWEICLECRPSEICVRFRCGCDLLYRHQIANLQFPGFNFQGSNVDPGGVWTVVIPCFLTCASYQEVGYFWTALKALSRKEVHHGSYATPEQV
ncbi:hypothetical protein L6452_31676 [Arctium lappa]|uniref:Uncharacterized protein n=1 Tax=Arctium lappa TaxID=4217 RepID=A0ACB8Z1P8_ARCLA|nr:hypothetical protein L6452_31676 [Arctium lappa]